MLTSKDWEKLLVNSRPVATWSLSHILLTVEVICRISTTEKVVQNARVRPLQGSC